MAKNNVFCQTRKECPLVCSTFVQNLDSDVYVDGKPNAKKRRVEMFHAGTPRSVKKYVLQNFSQPDVHISILACTVTFGMGVDCKGVHHVIHGSTLLITSKLTNQHVRKALFTCVSFSDSCEG